MANGSVQCRAERTGGFTKNKRKKFLDALALTCNVRRAAAYAGIHYRVTYRHRQTDAVFAEQWQRALSVGCDRLEMLLLEHGGAGEELDWPDPERAADAAGEGGAAVPPFDFDRALKVLQHLRGKDGDRAVSNRGRRRGESREQTNALLMKALAAAKRRVERSRADGD